MKGDCRLYLLSLLGVCFCTPTVSRDNKCLDRETFPLPGRGCFHPLSSEPCDEGEWAVLTSSGILSCELIPCDNVNVMFGGRCVNMYDTEACPNIGERLFWDDHGEGVCDCDIGWGRGEDGRCYQEFTRGFCQENSIIRIREEPSICKGKKKDGSYAPCIFPFILQNQVHTGCVRGLWPEALSEKEPATPWCPTAVVDNMTLIRDNWGFCGQDCQASAVQNHLVFDDQFRHLTRQLQRRQAQAAPNQELRCEDNPCGDYRISLPHTSTWNTTSLVCHNLTSHLSPDCLVAIAPDNTLKCCPHEPHEDRLECELGAFIVTHGIANTCLGRRCCRKRFVYSRFRQRCVRLFRRTGRATTRATTTENIKTTTIETTTVIPVTFVATTFTETES